MTTQSTSVSPRPRRSRGERAGLDLDAIIAVARTIAPEKLTMQAVADEMGVDRKAVNHHAIDRKTLLELVAWDAFVERFDGLEIGPEDDWQTACRVYSHAVADATVETGGLAEHLEMQGRGVGKFLDLTEKLLGRLIGAGLDDSTALGAIVMLTEIAMSHGRDRVRLAGEGRVRPAVTLATIRASSVERYPNLNRVVLEGVDTYAPAQLELGIEFALAGIRGRLARH